MKLAPMTQYKIAFYFVTFWLAIPFLFVVILAIFNPFWFRESFLRYTETLAGQLSKFRNELPLVKYYHDKAHLFDTLKA